MPQGETNCDTIRQSLSLLRESERCDSCIVFNSSRLTNSQHPVNCVSTGHLGLPTLRRRAYDRRLSSPVGSFT